MSIWDVTKPTSPTPATPAPNMTGGEEKSASFGVDSGNDSVLSYDGHVPTPPTNAPEQVSPRQPTDEAPSSTLSPGETTAKAAQRDTQLNWGTRMPPLAPPAFDEVSGGQIKELDTDPITMERGSNQFLRGNMDSATFRFAPDGNQLGEGQRIRTESPPYDGPDHINPAGSPQTSLEE